MTPAIITVAAPIMRMEMVVSNPCDKLERPKVQPSPPHGLAAQDVQKLLAVVPNTPVGLRDRAIILTLVLTAAAGPMSWG